MYHSRCHVKGWLHLSRTLYRNCFFLLVICLLPLSASAQSMRMSIHVKHKHITQALTLITQKTGITFFYNTEELNKLGLVSLRADNETVDNILQLLLKDKGLQVVRKNGLHVILPINSNAYNPPVVNISGRITDKNGMPLAQANIVEKGRRNNTWSNDSGMFHITVSPDAILQVSFLGMQTTSVAVKNRAFLPVSLQPAFTAINEVVINGYSTLKHQYSAASVSTVSAASLDRKDQLSIDNMLQGKVPGLAINRNSTSPGAAPKIRLRGTATLSGNREPIWVIDGIIVDAPVKLNAANINSLDDVNLMSSPVTGLNPKDIKQIDILKDAASTALYGVNSGNGVILITTRNGAPYKKPEITFSQMTNITFRPSYHHLNLMDAAQRMGLSKEIIDKKLPLSNGILPDGFERDYTGFLNGNMSRARFEQLEQDYRSMNTDWFNILFNNGVTQNYHLSVNGGGKKTAYYLSAGYTSETGPAIFTRARQYSGMLGASYHPIPGLQAGIKLSGASNTGSYPYQTDPYQYAYHTARSLPYTRQQQRMYYPPASPNWSVDNYVMDTSQVALFNIVSEMENSRTRTSVNTYRAVMNADWTFLRSFKLHGLYGLGSSAANNNSYALENTYYIASRYRMGLGPDMPYSDAAKGNIILPSGGEYQETATRQYYYTIRHSLEYSLKAHAHYIQLLAGNELRQSKYNTSKRFILGYYPGSGLAAYPPPASEYPMYNNFFTYSGIQPTAQFMDKYRQTSWYGMLVYSYKDRYTLNFNIRQDGANYFALYGNKPWQKTWSAAAKWRVLDEPLISRHKKTNNAIDIRVSYGYNIGLPEIKSTGLSISNPVQDPISGESQATIVNFDNPGLCWEKTYVFNAGIDFSFFDNRLYGTVEAYRKRSRDLLANINLAEENGFNAGMFNTAGIINNGIEVGLQYQVIRRRNWQWNIAANIAVNKTRVLQNNFTDPGIIGNQQQYLSGDIIKAGGDLNTMYAYKFTGLNSQGFPTFRGIYDRDYTVQPTVAQYYANVFVPAGRRIPLTDGSFSSNLKYRNWSLTTVFLVKLGYKQRLNNLYENGAFVPNPAENMSTAIEKRWKQPGDEKITDIPGVNAQNGLYLFDPIAMSPVQYYRFDAATMQNLNRTTPLYLMSTLSPEMYNNSDIRIVNASHIRLSTLSVQRNFPVPGNGRQLFKNISCYAQLHDVLLLADKRLNGQDPELPPGTLPRRPSFTFGTEINF